MITAGIPTGSGIAEIDGFEQRGEQNINSRLAKRKALMEIANIAGDQGRSYTPEEWASVVGETLGPAAFLNVSNPSQAMLDTMLKDQNARAAQVAEKQRRDQVKADAEENALIEKTARDLYMAGKSDIEVADELGQRFSPQRIEKVKPNLQRMRQSAMYDAEREGMQFGATKFLDLESFEKFAAENKGIIPEATLSGMRTAAMNNERQREARIVEIANTYGSSGFVDNNVAREELRQTIRTLAPDISKEAEERLLGKAVQVAKGAAQRSQTAREDKVTDAIRLGAANSYVNDVGAVTGVEMRERQLLEEQAKQQQAMLSAQIKAQQDTAELFAKDKKLSPERKVALVNASNNYIMSSEDSGLFADAVLRGDSATQRTILARSVPVERRRNDIQLISRVSSGTQPFPNYMAAVTTMSSLGMQPQEITDVGREMATRQQFIDKYASEPLNQRVMTTGRGGAVVSSSTRENPRAAEVANARAALDAAHRAFVDSQALFVKQMRTAIQANGTLEANPNQMLDGDVSLVSSRVSALADGMSLSGDRRQKFIEQTTQEILEKAGAPTGIVRRQSMSDAMRAAIQQRLRGNVMGGGFIPGSAQPSARGR